MPAKRPAKKAPGRPAKRQTKKATPSLARTRGVAGFEYNGTAVFVRAGVEEVASALKAHRRARQWERDVFGKAVTVGEQCFFVFRLRGHSWTQIIARDHAELDLFIAARRRGPDFRPPSAARKRQIADLRDSDAQALSTALSTEAIYYAVGDTSPGFEYVWFDKGVAVERMGTGEDEDVQFSSERRKVRDADVREPERFVDAFFRDRDVFEPTWKWDQMVGRYGPEAGEQITVSDPEDGYYPDLFERVDYIAV